MSARAIVRRPTARDSMCDRCFADIAEGEIAGYVEPGLHRIPWVAGAVLCSSCSSHLAYKYEREGGAVATSHCAACGGSGEDWPEYPDDPCPDCGGSGEAR